jgi:hypothetical protein
MISETIQAMVSSISFEADISVLQRELPDWAARRVPSITRNALNDTVEEARFAEIDKIRGVFDRPTPFTQRAPLYRKATKDNLVAEVYVRDTPSGGSRPPSKFLGPEVRGGPRQHKAFELALIRAGIMRSDEFALPAIGQRRDAYGNLPGSLIVQILSQLRAMSEVGYLANRTAKSAARAKRKGTSRFFVPQSSRGELGIGRLPRGIYTRDGNRIRGVLMFVGRPTYRKRYDFGQASIAKASRVFEPYWMRHFYAELAKRTGR